MFCVGRHLELLGDQRIMPMHQAMRVCMPTTVTGISRHHLQENCDLLVVQCGAQNQFILEVFRSLHCQHHQSLVVQGHQESGQRRLRHSRETSMLTFRCSLGKQWNDLHWGRVQIDLLHFTCQPALDTLTFFIQVLAAKVQPILQLKRCWDNTELLRLTWILRIWEHVPAIGDLRKKMHPLRSDCADRLLVCIRNKLSIPKRPQTKTAHKFSICPKRPMARSKTAHPQVQNGPWNKTVHKSCHTVYY